ncbi:MAG: uncharacterized protein A8A55_1529 [Amphiamblys sp. WSBS2006]|nr:MAG: uncharacterized protein A8A55_1529 [Amphiamblys sp. WSBS2006]
MKLALFVSVLFGCVAAVEDASDSSGSISGKEEEQVACSFKEKGASSFVSQGAALSAGVRSGVLPEQDPGRWVAVNEDQVFDMLEKIKNGGYAGKKPKRILDTESFGFHEFVFGKGDAGDEGADVVTFDFAKISDENKSRIKDSELDFGKIGYLTLSRNAVELLPMLKIHEDNKMDLLDLSCGTLSELGNLLERENKIFIGSVYKAWLYGYAINLLTKIETQEGNEMAELKIWSGSLSKIEPLLESEETLYLEEIKSQVFSLCENDKTEEKIREILETRNVIRDSWADYLSRRKGLSSKEGQGEAPSAGPRGGSLPQQNANGLPRVLAKTKSEDETFDVLEEIKEGACSEMALKRIFMRARYGEGFDSYEFVWKEKGDTDEGADVEFYLAKISDENKSRIKDSELDLGRIKRLRLYRNAVELLPMLKIHEDNKMDVLDLTCHTLSELGSLLKRENKVFIGLVDEISLRSYTINLLTKIETQEGNEMKTLVISDGSPSNIGPLLESKEKLYLGKIKSLDIKNPESNGMEKKIRDIIKTRNVIRDSGETGKAIGNQILKKMHQSISGFMAEMTS